MGIFRQFPYTNFHELNEDWLIKEIRRLADEWAEYQLKWEKLYDDTQDAVTDAQTLVANLTRYVHDYFDNLDIAPYVSDKIDDLVAQGVMHDIVLEKLSPVVTSWLNQHITVPSGVVIDSSLSVEGACADAKAAGDGIKHNREQLLDFNFYDLLKDCAETDRTYQGIQYQWNTNHTCRVTGTASALSFCNLIFANNALPEYWNRVLGKTLTAHYSGPNSRLNIIFYRNGTNIGSYAVIDTQRINVPADATGVVVRISVSQGTSCNETVSFSLTTDDPIDVVDTILKPVKYIDGLSYIGITDLDNVPLNTVSVDGGGSEHSPDAGAAYVLTFGRYTRIQMWIKFSTGDLWYRSKTGGSEGVWNPWVLVNASSSSGGFNPYASILCMGNSILNGSVWINGAFSRLSQYGNAPYSVIANAMNVDRIHVTNELHSSTGIIYDAGEGNFIDNIMQHDITNTDIIITHMWTGDMNTALGTQSSTADMSTIIGAVKLLYNWIKSQNGNCQLVLIGVPPCSYTISGDTVFTGRYPNNSSIADVDTALKILADNLHFTYVDWEDLNISYYYQDYTDGNNVHANNENTYRVMGAYLAGRISSKISF